MAQEIEVKFRLDDRRGLIEKLRAAGAEQLYPETFEDNIVMDRRGELRTRGALLRVRRFGKYVMVTYKGPMTIENGIKTREEVQGGVESVEFAVSLLGALGFKSVFRYQKLREVWRVKSTEIVIDRTPIGDYFEIEGSMDLIREVIDEFGLRLEEAVKATYIELYKMERRSRPELPENMVFNPEDLPG